MADGGSIELNKKKDYSFPLPDGDHLERIGLRWGVRAPIQPVGGMAGKPHGNGNRDKGVGKVSE